MAKPTKPIVPPPALRSQPATFSANLEGQLVFYPTLTDYMDAIADFVDIRADEALAAAIGGSLPSLTGHAGEFLRVKTDGSAVEFKRAMTLTALSATGDVAFTNTGKNMIEAADVAAQRTLLGLGVSATKNFSTKADWSVDVTALSDRATIKTFVENTVSPAWNSISAVNISSGNSVSISGPLSSAKEIIIEINNLSLDNTDNPRVKLIDGGTIKTTGYVASSLFDGGSLVSSTVGFPLRIGSATRIMSGNIKLNYNNALDIWEISCFLRETSGGVSFTSAYGFCSNVANLSGINLDCPTGNFDGASATMSVKYR